MTDRAPNATLAIAATFTAEPLLPGLSLILREAGLSLLPQCAPYNQVFQELLSPSSLLTGNAGGANVLLIRVEDFVREIADRRPAPALIERTCGELSSALSQFAQRAPSPTVLALLPPSPLTDDVLRDQLATLTQALAQQARRLPGVYLLDAAEVERVADGERYDPLRDELAHIPYTEEFYAALALAIGRKLHALLLPAHKVLALDCDNTLWRGVIGEDGLQGIVLSEAMLRVQRFACQVQAAGGLICLVSKNAEADVLEVFAKQPSMLLKAEHIVAHRINWKSKAENLASLASELQLGLDSFVLLDDNPIECAQVQTALPQVVTLQLPPEAEIDRFLSHLWTFDKITVTAEDLRRTDLYRENAARQQLEEAATDLGGFIASLHLEIDIGAPQEDEWPRLAQLTQRTNQFNFTTVRRNEAELRAWQAVGSPVLRVRVKDRFGDYGLVGLALAKVVAGELHVDTLLLSCRVLGRGVEHAVLRRLGEIASAQRLAHVALPFVPTARNEPAAAFADSVANAYRIEQQGQIVYRIPTLFACNITHRPGHDPAAVINARKAEQRLPVTSTATLNRSERYARLARDLVSGQALLEAVRAHDRRPRRLTGKTAGPATDVEKQLLLLWQEVLNVEGLGVEDDYFALGGTSLLAARIFAEISRRFDVKLRLTTILDAPTVRALARYLEPYRAERSGVMIELKPGGRQNLFLVHDGDGETLLYRNLAQHMPDEVSVFGIEPRRTPQIPLAHTRIEHMARCYIDEIRTKQPHGPYLLGGLCAGGVIAYEMALQLKAAGEPVKLVAILDAAKPQARKRRGLYSKERARRFGEMFSDARRERGKLLARTWYLTKALSRKVASFTAWQVSLHARRLALRVRFQILHEQLLRQTPWPSYLPRLSVRDIYDSAEARYVPATFADAGVVLVRARYGEGADTPYREIYADDTFGWGLVAPAIEVIDVEGGHSSMLQEPFVESLAAALRLKLQEDSARLGSRTLAAQHLETMAV
jgi:FkbH-like protein